MLKVLKSSVRDTFIYSIGTLSSKLAGLVLVPIYTNESYLTTTSYGLLNLIEANIQVGIFIFSLGLNYAYERWYWDKAFLEKRKSLFFTILVFTLVVGLMLLVSSFFISDKLARLFFNHSSYAYIVQLMLITTAFEMVAQTPNSLMRLAERPVLYTWANMVKLVVSVITTVICLVLFKTGLRGVYYGQLTGIVGYFIATFPFLVNHSQPRFEWREVFEMIRFRLPYLFPILALNILAFSDRYIISNLNGISEAGVYALGAKVANTLKVFLINAIWLAITPTIFRMMDETGNKRFYSKIMTYLGFAVMFFAIALALFGNEFVILISDESVYMAAAAVVPITAMAIFFGLLKDVSLIGLNIAKRSGAVGVITVIMIGTNIGLNFVLIPTLGIIGAAYTNLITQILFFAAIYWCAQRVYYIPYELSKIFLMILVAFGIIGAMHVLPQLHAWILIPVKSLMLLSFPLVLFVFNFFEPVELKRLKGLWKKWRNPTCWKKNFSTLEF